MGKERREGRQSRERSWDDGLGPGALRLRELIREKVNLMFKTGIRAPAREDVSITFVELTLDGSCARLWFSAAGMDDKAEALTRATGFLRTRLAESLGLKRTPELRLRRDEATRTFDPAAAKSMEEF